MPDSPSIHHQLITALNDQSLDDSLFNSLALNVFRFQYAHNTVYRNYCDALGQQPEVVTQWQQIPAVPTDTFKLEEYPMVSFQMDQRQKTFHTSGTTTEVKGQHHFPSLELYEKSILAAWRKLQLPRPENSVILTPHPDDAPQSSLSHMMGVLADEYGKQVQWSITMDGKLDTQSIIEKSKRGKPVALLGTALALLHLCDQLDQPPSLPTGSWVMETGGYKGTNQNLSKEELYHIFEKKLGISRNSIINEYSMTELSSQFYSRGLATRHTGPDWTRIRVIDPLTGTDAAIGSPGHLVIYDLANLHSVMAISTQDLAIRNESDLAEGDRSFSLLGRDPSALPRGCSRAADHRLNS